VKNPASLSVRRDATGKRSFEEVKADALLRTGVVCNARVIRSFHTNRNALDIDACVKVLEEAAKRVSDGDCSGCESILMAQAVALNTIFSSMAVSAERCELMSHMEVFMKMALKAQNQCRSTIDTLAQIRHPRQTVITKQANISNGHQQVNNTLNQGCDQEPVNLENLEIEQNKLLKNHEQEKGERLDSGKKGAAGWSDLAMAAVDKVDRGKN
jgi:hypothetical protein